MTARWLCLSFGILVGALLPRVAISYELRTHEEITRRAFEASTGLKNYLTSQSISPGQTFDPNAVTRRAQLAQFQNTGTAVDWMIEGAIREDDFAKDARGVLGGCPRPRNPPSEIHRVLNHFLDVQHGGRGLTVLFFEGIPAHDWALGRQGRGGGPKQNQFSLPDAREYQYQSLVAPSPGMRDKNTALLFRGLGQVLHLVEDMAQPQHTRNDVHANCLLVPDAIVGGPSWYEEYTENRTLRQTFPRTIDVPSPLVLGGYEPIPTRPYQDFFSEAGRQGLADFSSRNFFSAGTNLGVGSGSCGGLVQPSCEATAYRQVFQPFSTTTLKGAVSGSVTLYTGNVFDTMTGQVLQGVPLSSKSIWDESLLITGIQRFTLNRFNYDAMADILLPRAVGYAAGFLDTFFRGFVGATFDDQQGFKITGSDELMVGDFKFLYETPDGTRTDLTTWNLRIEPNGASPTLSAPQLPPDATEATCWLVFRGQLGLESGAVAASRVPCRYEPPPPPPSNWYVYYCTTFFAADSYFYATLDPPWEGGPLLHFQYRQESTATIFNCSLKSHGAASLPPGALTEHPA
jgi:hypothetical protein